MDIKRFEQRLSIQSKVALLLGVMLVIAAVNVGAVYYFIQQSETVGNSVNTAGQQRMLTQRMARFSAQIATGDGTEESRDALRGAMEKYQSNLEALETGGTANGATLQPAPDATREELKIEKQAWAEYKPHVETILDADPGSEEFQQSFAYVQSNSDTLLTKSDDLTTAFAAVSTAKMGFMKQLLLGLFGVDIGVFAVSILYARRTLSNPIQELADAADALAEGQFGATALQGVRTSNAATDRSGKVNDEVTLMAGSFDELQGILQQTFDQLQAVSDGLETGTLDADIQTGAPGVYGEVMDGLDEGAAQMRGSFQEIQEISDDLRNGTLDQNIETDRPGTYGVVLSDLSEATRQLSNSFEQISTASEGLKEGQLDRRLDTDYPGAFGDVLTDLDAGIEQLSVSLRSVQKIADEAAAASAEATSSSDEVERASEEVADSVEEISHGAEDQSENLQEVAGEMNDMSATVEEIASSSEEVTSTASTAVQRSEAGQEYAAEATEEIESIESQADKAAMQVETLDENMDEIVEIVEMITEIAEQTNMLALNASIEAARAGEAGEGFAVVADEIKALAGEVSDATADIEQRIAAVQSTTGETVDSIEQMSQRVERGSETIEEAIEMFDDIASAVRQAESGIEEISAATDDQAASSEEVVAMVDEVSSVSQQTAAEASNVSAATEEQTASLAEISDNIKHLSQLSENLHSQISMFEIRDVDTAVADDRSGATGAAAQADGGTPVSRVSSDLPQGDRN
ncbi:MAG: methyl-accepting chemotaxis protein [Haloarculaceae archaeon]